jgi:acyl-ACP thioesterase
MAAPASVEVPYRVRFEECGPDGAIRPSTYLRWAQDAAWVHSEVAGFDRPWYAARDLAWVVRCLTLDVVGAGDYGDAVTLTTEVIALRRVLARRRGTVRGQGGELLAIVDTDWLLTTGGTAPARIPPEIQRAFPVPGTFEPARVPLPPTPSAAQRRTFHVRRSELDPNGHVNNAAYLDYLEESLAEAGARSVLAARPRRYELEYQAAAAAGAALTGATWLDDPAWAYRLADDAGADVVRARFSASPAEASAATGDPPERKTAS